MYQPPNFYDPIPPPVINDFNLKELMELNGTIHAYSSIIFQRAYNAIHFSSTRNITQINITQINTPNYEWPAI